MDKFAEGPANKLDEELSNLRLAEVGLLNDINQAQAGLRSGAAMGGAEGYCKTLEQPEALLRMEASRLEERARGLRLMASMLPGEQFLNLDARRALRAAVVEMVARR
jgi:hypothetical protein